MKSGIWVLDHDTGYPQLPGGQRPDHHPGRREALRLLP